MQYCNEITQKNTPTFGQISNFKNNSLREVGVCSTHGTCVTCNVENNNELPYMCTPHQSLSLLSSLSLPPNVTFAP
jgi:ferredoxin